MEQKNLQNLTHHQIVSSSHSLKKSTKLLFSLSVFSFLLSHYYYSSSSSSSFMNSSSGGYFSTITLSLNFDKNYVFLIFNGILVFIARSTLTSTPSSGSGSLPSPSTAGFESNYYEEGDDDDHRLVINNDVVSQYGLPSDHALELGSTTTGESIRVVERSSELGVIEEHDQLDMLYNLQQQAMIKEEGGEILRSSSLNTTTTFNDHHDDVQYNLKFLEDEEPVIVVDGKCEAGEEEEENGEEDQVIIHNESNDINGINYQINAGWRHEGEEVDATNNIGAMSTEELNKKFDEFIRRMKEEIRIDAERQLIMV